MFRFVILKPKRPLTYVETKILHSCAKIIQQTEHRNKLLCKDPSPSMSLYDIIISNILINCTKTLTIPQTSPSSYELTFCILQRYSTSYSETGQGFPWVFYVSSLGMRTQSIIRAYASYESLVTLPFQTYLRYQLCMQGSQKRSK